jgi:tetratricopeptide (TPR) repeat protein
MIVLWSKPLSAPLFRFAAALLASSLLALGPAPSLSQSNDAAGAQKLFVQGQDLAAQGRLAEAEIPLTQAVSLAPKDPALLSYLAKVKGRLGEPAEAVALLRRVIQLQPRAAQNHLDLAIALADAGQLSAALSETTAAIALEPRSAAAHLNRARLLADLHRNPEARTEFALANKLAPDDPDDLYYWSLIEHDDNHLAKETELLQRLVKLQPESARDFFRLGRSLSEQSRHPEAIAALRRAVEINPHAGDALYMLAREMQHDNPAEYRALMQRFGQVRDEDAALDTVKSLGNQAYAASQRQDWPEAVRLLRQALATCGDCSVAGGLHRNLGLNLCRNGDLQEGEQELQAALALDPQDRDAATALHLLQK